ncbi:hypothetical protein MKZ38_001224 [Zalerion maritima]|uniref:C2H2-type domain-containing protein n=1 Tax=Zalerion maritima TaxID=339359 RepID=A0AAD5RF07_9PEZI|nr:hypothetical protein MKZ38_001224 [Zalerion maritima]
MICSAIPEQPQTITQQLCAHSLAGLGDVTKGQHTIQPPRPWEVEKRRRGRWWSKCQASTPTNVRMAQAHGPLAAQCALCFARTCEKWRSCMGGGMMAKDVRKPRVYIFQCTVYNLQRITAAGEAHQLYCEVETREDDDPWPPGLTLDSLTRDTEGFGEQFHPKKWPVTLDPRQYSITVEQLGSQFHETTGAGYPTLLDPPFFLMPESIGTSPPQPNRPQFQPRSRPQSPEKRSDPSTVGSTKTGGNKRVSARRSQSRKRTRSHADSDFVRMDSSDLDDRGAPKQCRQSSRDDKSDDARCFACPLYRQNPASYNSCGKYFLRRVKDVKQHILRVHCLPEHFCPMCLEGFDTVNFKVEHMQEKSCELRDLGPDTMPAEKRTELTRLKVARGHSNDAEGGAESHWLRMWEIIFPGVRTPSKQLVYLSSPCQESIFVLRYIWDLKGKSILSEIEPDIRERVGSDNRTFWDSHWAILEDTMTAVLDNLGARGLQLHSGKQQGGGRVEGRCDGAIVEPSIREPSIAKSIVSSPSPIASELPSSVMPLFLPNEEPLQCHYFAYDDFYTRSWDYFGA